MRIIFIIVFIFCWWGLKSQTFSSRSPYEKHWALEHPFAALKVKKIYKKCLPIYNSFKKHPVLDSFENGGKADAFRHAFFMAAFTQKIKTKKIRKLGIAHEKGNYNDFLNRINEQGELPDSLSSIMDLQNNELGFMAGRSNRKKNLDQLGLWIVSEIKDGRAVYFKRNSLGKYLNCNGEVIILENYKNKWFIPKCLLRTNE